MSKFTDRVAAFVADNAQDAVIGTAKSEAKHGVAELTKSTISNWPAALKFVNGISKTGVRMSTAALLSVLRQNREVFGPGNEWLVDKLNEGIEIAAEGAAEGVDDLEFNDDMAARVTARLIATTPAGDIECFYTEGHVHPIEFTDPIDGDVCTCDIFGPVDRLYRQAHQASTTKSGGNKQGQQSQVVTTNPQPMRKVRMTLRQAQERGLTSKFCSHLVASEVTKVARVSKKSDQPQTLEDAIPEDLLAAYSRVRLMAWRRGESSEDWLLVQGFTAMKSGWGIKTMTPALRRAAIELEGNNKIAEETYSEIIVHINSVVNPDSKDRIDAFTQRLFDKVMNPRRRTQHGEADRPSLLSSWVGWVVSALGVGACLLSVVLYLAVVATAVGGYVYGWVKQDPLIVFGGMAAICLSIWPLAIFGGLAKLVPNFFWRLLGKEKSTDKDSWLKGFAAEVPFFFVMWGFVVVDLIVFGLGEPTLLTLVAILALLTAATMKLARSKGWMKPLVELTEYGSWKLGKGAWIVVAIMIALIVTSGVGTVGSFADKGNSLTMVDGVVELTNEAGLPSSLPRTVVFPGAVDRKFVASGDDRVLTTQRFSPDLPGFVVRTEEENCGGATCYGYSFRPSTISRLMSNIGLRNWWANNRYSQIDRDGDGTSADQGDADDGLVKKAQAVQAGGAQTPSTEKVAESPQTKPATHKSWLALTLPGFILWGLVLAGGIICYAVIIKFLRVDDWRWLRTLLAIPCVLAVIVAIIGLLWTPIGGTYNWATQKEETQTQATTPAETPASPEKPFVAPTRPRAVTKTASAPNPTATTASKAQARKDRVCPKLRDPYSRKLNGCDQ